jgi:hypothetical protein
VREEKGELDGESKTGSNSVRGRRRGRQIERARQKIKVCGRERWHDDASPNKTSLVISTLDYEPLWSVCPKGKTDQWILRPKYYLSLDVASQPIFSLFGDFMTILNLETLIIIFGHCVPIHNIYGFL